MMTEHELLSIVNHAQRDAVKYQGEFSEINENAMKYYLGLPYGNEVEGESQVVSTDVFDVIESDMPALARVFLGAQDIMQFAANTENEADIAEAEEKTKYINWLIKNQKNSFKTLLGWIKDAEIQKLGVVKYSYETKTDVDEVVYKGLSDEELSILINDLYAENSDVELLEPDEEGEFRFKVTREKSDFVIRGVPVESFLISRNATSKDEAELVGDVCMKRRGELIAEGFDEDLVRSLSADNKEDDDSTQKQIRFRQEGGEKEDNSRHWTMQEVEVCDLYVLVDYDEDGIPERRHIVKAGNRILVNEPFPMAPYATMSAIAMPHSAIGRSRAEITMSTQYTKSILQRQLLNNIYQVNNTGFVANDEETNFDDLLNVRTNRVVRTENPNPAAAVAQLNTQYIGQEALQVIQYMDSARAASTGTMLANQGLETDSLYNETATRFEGVRDAGAAKVELVARTMAETGFRELFEGLAWMVSHYQDDKKEFRVLGKQLTVDPRMWRYDHCLVSNVGLAAGDDETILANMSGILTIQNQLQQQGSLLVDEKAKYNALDKIVKAMGLSRTGDYFNDPEQPQELLQAQNEQLILQVQQLTLALEQANPLAQQEQIRQQGALQREQMKVQADMQREALRMRDKQLDREQDASQFDRELMKDLIDIEATTGANASDQI